MAKSDQSQITPNLKSLLTSGDVKLFEQLMSRFAMTSGVAGVQQKVLISKRFDIQGERALSFEDFCVLQGKTTKEKYDASLESYTNTIRQYISSIYQQKSHGQTYSTGKNCSRKK